MPISVRVPEYSGLCPRILRILNTLPRIPPNTWHADASGLSDYEAAISIPNWNQMFRLVEPLSDLGTVLPSVYAVKVDTSGSALGAR